MKTKFIAATVVAAGLAAGLTACTSDSSRVSDNLSTEAEQFHVYREIVFINAITDKYLADIKGYCSVDGQAGLPGGTIAVTCKKGPHSYIKDYLGKSDNVTWYMLQADGSDVSPYHYEIVLKPANIVPSFTGSDATP